MNDSHQIQSPMIPKINQEADTAEVLLPTLTWGEIALPIPTQGMQAALGVDEIAIGGKIVGKPTLHTSHDPAETFVMFPMVNVQVTGGMMKGEPVHIVVQGKDLPVLQDTLEPGMWVTVQGQVIQVERTPLTEEHPGWIILATGLSVSQQANRGERLHRQ